MPGWRVQVSQEFTPEFVSYPNLRRFMSNELRNFLALSYDELEQLESEGQGAAAKNTLRCTRFKKNASSILTDEKRIKGG